MGTMGRCRMAKHDSYERPQGAGLSYRLMAVGSVRAMPGGYQHGALNLVGAWALPGEGGDRLPASGRFDKVVLEGDDAYPRAAGVTNRAIGGRCYGAGLLV